MVRKILLSVAIPLSLLQPVSASAQQVAAPSAVVSAVAAEIAQTPAPPPPFAYSDGYRVRAKIHRIGSFTMLPLLATQGLLGRSLYENPTLEKRQWHRRIAWGVGGLFAVDSITGVLNLVESRKDPHKRKLRVAHGLLMVAADAGFLATAILRPDATKPDFSGQRSTHRAIAFTSIAVATTGYLLMVFGQK